MNDPSNENMVTNQMTARRHSESFDDDCFYFLQWAGTRDWFSQLNTRKPGLHISGPEMAAIIDDAFEMLESEDIRPPEVNQLEDLVSPRCFPLIVQQAERRLNAQKRARLIALLIGVAHDWVRLPKPTITALYEAARPILTEMRKSRPD